jgi:hypothetical protein
MNHFEGHDSVEAVNIDEDIKTTTEIKMIGYN